MNIQKTIYDNFLFKIFIPPIASFILKLLSWKVDEKAPTIPKYVLICAPHTSNWDFVIAILINFKFELNAYLMVKNNVAIGPIKSLIKWIGMIPIDRTKSNNTVDQVIDIFNKREKFIIGVPPSGTRSKVKKWKTGFYHIAKGAKVPIVLSSLNYKTKEAKFITTFFPIENTEKGIEKIQSYYKGVRGKYPEKQLVG